MARNKKNEPAKDALAPAFEKRVYDWRDKYVTRIERDMTTAFPCLEKALLGRVEENLGMILMGKAEEFSKSIVVPEVETWVERTITPIKTEAAKELEIVAFEYDDLLDDGFEISQVTLVALPAGLALGGLAIIVTGFLVGITTTTILGIAISSAVNWPIVVGAALVGATLLATGAVQLSHIAGKVSAAFNSVFIPKLRDCLIGKGFEVKGKHHDSLCRQFQEAVEKTAEEILANRKPTSGL